ncbi:MAG: hypothetical protein CMB80_27600 [Flammeovirgaceae bacterium]|nr:hypothetical protein [Flammeovirgaceae bacterium]MBR11378.1 hypothetical protein [Rickettsiales bacterium]|tara:strand:- start:303 stop:923 length:621 start_codon:yes stop_codon:yes gene_type:complete
MKKFYFLAVSSLLLVLSFIAFSDNLITDIGQKSNSDPKFIIHGLFMFAWFGTFVMQSAFIIRGNYQAHIKWGKIGFLISVGVFLSTVYVFISIFKGWDVMEPFVKANRLLWLSFATLILLAYLYRQNPVVHKRLIFWAIILPIEPVMGRVSYFFDIDSWELFYALVWHSFFASFFLYDWLTLKRIHRISWLTLLWFYLAWTISIYS